MESDTKMLKTYIKGLDALLYEGIPEKSQILIAGGPGTGKTLLTFEIAYRSALNGIPSVFIAFDERPENVIRNVKLTFPEFKDIDKLITNKLLSVEGESTSSKISTTVDPEAYSFGSLVSDLEDIIKGANAKVVIIDSISLIKLMLGKSAAYRRSMISIISNLRRLGATTFFTAEMHSPERQELEFGQEFFLFDGLIMLYQVREEQDRVLALEVMKMRGGNHSRALVPYDIKAEGFKLTNV